MKVSIREQFQHSFYALLSRSWIDERLLDKAEADKGLMKAFLPK